VFLCPSQVVSSNLDIKIIILNLSKRSPSKSKFRVLFNLIIFKDTEFLSSKKIPLHGKILIGNERTI